MIVTLALAMAVEASAENVKVWGVPGVRPILEGATVAPAGRPLSCTLIDEENPLDPEAESVAEAVPPASMGTLVGLTVRLKSGLGVGVGAGGGVELPPPPQDTRRIENETTTGNNRRAGAQARHRFGLFFPPGRRPILHVPDRRPIIHLHSVSQ